MDNHKWMMIFVEMWHDMCKSTQHCSKCRARDACPAFFETMPQEIVDAVEEWNEEREKEMMFIEGA